MPEFLSTIQSVIHNLAKRRVKGFVRNAFHSLCYYLVSPRLNNNGTVKNIVFVCKGNICRSPFAEYALKTRFRYMGNYLAISSCSIETNQDNHPPELANEVAKSFGIDLRSHTARPMDEILIKCADVILAMEYNQYRKLCSMYPDKVGNIGLMRKLAGFPSNIFCDIDDPYGQDKREFKRCYQLISKAISNMCVAIGEPKNDIS